MYIAYGGLHHFLREDHSPLTTYHRRGRGRQCRGAVAPPPHMSIECFAYICTLHTWIACINYMHILHTGGLHHPLSPGAPFTIFPVCTENTYRTRYQFDGRVRFACVFVASELTVRMQETNLSRMLGTVAGRMRDIEFV